MGNLEVIVGGMYSGKTEELIRRLRRASLGRQKVQVFKPRIDNRYHEQEVTSHDLNSVHAVPIEKPTEMLNLVKSDTKVVGIDEGQFFDATLVPVVQEILNRGTRVIVAGLDLDWKAQPFEPMPTLMALAEFVTKQRAVCHTCGEAASFTQRVARGEARVEVGSHGIYEARCRLHFRPEVSPPSPAATLDEPAQPTPLA